MKDLLENRRKEFEEKFLKNDFSGEKASLNVQQGELAYIADLLSFHDQTVIAVLEKMREDCKDWRAKWIRPNLDKAVGEKTAELVGEMGAHIVDEFVNHLTSSIESIKEKQ